MFNFRKCKSLLEWIVHGLENVSMPSVVRDWDMDKGSIEDHKRRRTRVFMEMLLIMIVRAVFHAVMVLPIILLGNNIINYPKQNLTHICLSYKCVGKA